MYITDIQFGIYKRDQSNKNKCDSDLKQIPLYHGMNQITQGTDY